MTKQRKKILIFTLGAKTLDKNYGPRYQDAIGMAYAMNNLGYDVQVSDNLSDKNPDDYSKIWIAPRSLTLFKDRPEVIQDVKTQIDFINRLKKSKHKTDKLVLFFDDVALKMDDDYPYSIDNEGNKILDFNSDKYDSIFGDLHYLNVFDYEYHPGIDYVKDIFMGEKEKKKHTNLFIMNWILLAHLPKIIEESYMIEKKTNEEINNLDYHLYYGGYRPQVVDSLLKLGFGKEDQNNVLYGSSTWAKNDHFKSIEYNESLPMSELMNTIASSKYLYVPDEDKKSGSQLTARIMEMIIFKNDNAKIIWGDSWKEQNDLFRKPISELTKDDLLDLSEDARNDLSMLI